MKLSRYVGLVRKHGFCNVVHVQGSGIWLGTKSAIYQAEELPDMHGSAETAAVLDLDAKAMMKIEIKENDCPGRHNIFGLDLTDDVERDMNATDFKVAAVVDGRMINALVCDDGELVFYDPLDLAPLAEVLKSAYAKLVVRTDDRGIRYIVVRDGFDVLAGILPVHILQEEYLADLNDFLARCTEQFFKESDTGAEGAAHDD